MNEFLQIAQGIVEQGLIFSLVVAAVYLASRLINIDNLAVEGAFGLGGAVTAALIFRGFNPWIAVLGALLIGILSGIASGWLITHLKLNSLISGIVVTTGAFSLMLKIAGSNMSIGGHDTIFSAITSSLYPLLVLATLVIVLYSALAWLLKSEVGYVLFAVGDSPQMVINIGKSLAFYTTLGLIISNSLAALAGSLFVQYVGYFSLWAGVGVLIIGLAGTMIAQIISSSFGIALIIGSIIYQAIIALTFELQLDPDWNKLVTALLIVILLVIKQQIQQHERSVHVKA